MLLRYFSRVRIRLLLSSNILVLKHSKWLYWLTAFSNLMRSKAISFYCNSCSRFDYSIKACKAKWSWRKALTRNGLDWAHYPNWLCFLFNSYWMMISLLERPSSTFLSKNILSKSYSRPRVILWESLIRLS